VWLEVRNAGGELLLADTAAWTSVNAGVASVANGKIKAVAPGSTTVTAMLAGISRDVAVTVLPVISATQLSVLGQTLRSIDDRAELQARSVAGTESREGQYTFTVRDTKIVSLEDVTAFGHAYAKALTAGLTYVVVAERGGTVDSTLIAVQPSLARLTFGGGIGGCEGRMLHPVLTGTDAGGTPFQTTSVTFRTLDSSIVLPDAGGLKLLKPGATRVEAVSDLGAHAYAEVGVLSRSKLDHLLIDDEHLVDSASIGTQQIILGAIEATGSCADTAITATVLDSSIVSVSLKPQLTITGKHAGSTKIILSAPLTSGDTIPVTVTTSRIFLGDDYDGQIVVGDSSRPVFTFAADSLGRWREYDADMVFTVTSSDTNVISIDPRWRQFTVDRRSDNRHGLPIKAVSVGTARVTASSPGLVPAVFDYTVSELPRLILTPSDTVMGAGQTTATDPPGQSGNVQWRLAVSAQVANADVTITHSNPLVGRTPASFTVTPLMQYYGFDVDALTAGVDTIIASAPGFSPDTAVLLVTTPHFSLLDSLPVTCVGCNEGALMSAADSLFHPHLATAKVTVLVTADDSSVVVPAKSQILAHGFLNGVLMTVLDTGRATLHLRDSAGGIAGRDFVIHSILSTHSRAYADDHNEMAANGIGQTFETPSGFLLDYRTPTPLPVTYWSTNPAVLPVSGTMTIGVNGNSATVPLPAGLTAGSARIVYSARGFPPDTSDQIVIGTPRLQMVRFPAVVRAGMPDTVIVGLTDQRGRTRRSQTAVTATLSVLDGGLTPVEFTIAAGATQSAKIPVIFTRGGSLQLVASGGTATVAYAPDTAQVISRADPVALIISSTVVTVGIGQLLDVPLVRSGGVASNPLPVSAATQTARAELIGTVSFPAGVESQIVHLVGRAAGVDTLTVSANGLAADSLRVAVTEGRIRFSGLPTSLKAGTDYNVTLVATDSAGGERHVQAATEFSVALSDGMSLTDKDGAPVTRITIGAGESTSATLTLHAQVSGDAAVLVSRLDYLPLRQILKVVP
jgi:hypothetical protein